MKIQQIVMIAVIVAAISLGLQVASNTKLQSDIKNVTFKTTEQDIAIQHLTIGLNNTLQMSDLKNRTTEQEQLIRSLSNELDASKQIEEKNNITITQLQQNATNLNGEIKLLSDRLNSIENRIPSLLSLSVNTTSIPKYVNTTSIPKYVNTTSTSILIQNKTNVTEPILNPANQTISMTKSEIKIVSIEMSPNPLTVGAVPQFTVAFQNISDKVIFQNEVGCGTDPSLHWEISPSSSVQTQFVQDNGLTCAPIIKNVQPNEISFASGTGTNNASYQIKTAGELNVILRMNLEDGTISGIQSIIQFNINATR